MADPTIRERLRELAEKATKTPWQALVRLDADPAHLVPPNSIGIGAGEAVPAGVIADVTRVAAIAAPANAEYIVEAVNSLPALLDDLDTLERRAIAATEALERLSDVGWVLAGITPEGERIEPPDGTWHDLDAALEQARAALEASRGSA